LTNSIRAFSCPGREALLQDTQAQYPRDVPTVTFR
jgi:hypothetical protein